MGRAYVSFAQEFPVYFEAIARFESSGSQSGDARGNVLACAAASERIHQLLIGAIERGQQDGSIATDLGPPRLIAITLWGFMHGIVQMSMSKELTLNGHGVTRRMLTEMAFSLARRLGAPSPALDPTTSAFNVRRSKILSMWWFAGATFDEAKAWKRAW